MADYAAITAALYEKHDSDKNGTLEPVEIRPFFDELIAARPDLGFTADDFDKWFGSIDLNSDGTIAPDELQGYLAGINYSA
jgi:hypothetical protein